MWKTFLQLWDYFTAQLLVGLYMMLGAALGLILMWLFLASRLL